MLESKEYKRLMEILAKKLCERCEGTGRSPAIPPHGNLTTPRNCPDCKGTGQSNIKVLFTQEDILKGFNIPDGEGGYYCLGHIRKPVERPQLVIEEVKVVEE